MNRKQRQVVKVGLVLMLCMGLFPPWEVTVYRAPWTLESDEVRPLSVEHRYRFIAAPPSDRSGRVQHVVLGWRRLRYQWMVAALAILLLLVLYRDRHGGDGYGGDGSGHFSPDDPLLEPGIRRPSDRVLA